jgi:hypothetical protein
VAEGPEGSEQREKKRRMESAHREEPARSAPPPSSATPLRSDSMFMSDVTRKIAEIERSSKSAERLFHICFYVLLITFICLVMMIAALAWIVYFRPDVMRQWLGLSSSLRPPPPPPSTQRLTKRRLFVYNKARNGIRRHTRLDAPDMISEVQSEPDLSSDRHLVLEEDIDIPVLPEELPEPEPEESKQPLERKMSPRPAKPDERFINTNLPRRVEVRAQA